MWSPRGRSPPPPIPHPPPPQTLIRVNPSSAIHLPTSLPTLLAYLLGAGTLPTQVLASIEGIGPRTSTTGLDCACSVLVAPYGTQTQTQTPARPMPIPIHLQTQTPRPCPQSHLPNPDRRPAVCVRTVCRFRLFHPAPPSVSQSPPVHIFHWHLQIPPSFAHLHPACLATATATATAATTATPTALTATITATTTITAAAAAPLRPSHTVPSCPRLAHNLRLPLGRIAHCAAQPAYNKDMPSHRLCLQTPKRSSLGSGQH